MTLRVLVTRSAADAESLAGPIRELGMEPVLVPLVERRHDPRQVAAIAERGHDGWVLTSAAVVQALATIRARPRWVAAVGPATAQAAREAGLTVDLMPERATARELARALGDRRGQRVLYPRAAVASPGTIEALRETGAIVDDVIAYHNVEPAGAGEALARAWPLHAITLLSGSAARRFAAHCPPPWQSNATVFVIGPRTEQAALEAGLPVHQVAEPHTVGGMVESLETWASERHP